MKKLVLFGEIPVNCYIIEHNNKCYIIDPGYEKERVIEYIKKYNLEVLGILLTHGHIDHIGAINAFDVPVYLHEKEFEIIEDNVKNGFKFYGREKEYELKDINLIPIYDEYVLNLDDKQIVTMYTPGHTIGGVCYKIEDDLYTGDTLFENAVGKWTFPTGDLETLKRTVVNLIDSQEEHIKIHPAHGASSTIGQEKKYNDFYVQWKKELG